MTDDVCTKLQTRTGLALLVRQAGPEDAPTLVELFHNVSPEDLRFRFLTGLNEVGADQIKAMTQADHSTIDSYIAFQPDGIAVATGMLACDKHGERGEVAISVHASHHNQGIGWTLLAFLAERATARGLKVIESIENRGNRTAIEVERDSGFSLQEYPGDPTLVLVTRNLANPTGA
ncbi:GNAT family N-acetyltransferase [Sphingobium sp.]|uniref:GNAT family N-acetyltransferase n=1 Tax=Sphingobium sp. TaxID=1912891 RepID=UPI000DB7C071|nr:GNAT family N-acetyltransferase [Sphingobium sp.]PZU64835.1 MAG: GNAT family N-acetyltransferase [Sphingobium sp.]